VLPPARYYLSSTWESHDVQFPRRSALGHPPFLPPPPTHTPALLFSVHRRASTPCSRLCWTCASFAVEEPQCLIRSPLFRPHTLHFDLPEAVPAHAVVVLDVRSVDVKSARVESVAHGFLPVRICSAGPGPGVGEDRRAQFACAARWGWQLFAREQYLQHGAFEVPLYQGESRARLGARVAGKGAGELMGWRAGPPLVFVLESLLQLGKPLAETLAAPSVAKHVRVAFRTPCLRAR
jgi:hypothetical protein